MSHGCEVQLLAWMDTSTGGARIVLQLADVADLAYFQQLTMAKGRGKTAIAGQRLMAAFEEIGDDEQPVQTKQGPGPLCLLAVQWCGDVVFHEWLQTVWPATWNGALAGKTVGEEELAARIIREVCNVLSRKDIDTNPAAAQTFHDKFRLPYAAWLRGNG